MTKDSKTMRRFRCFVWGLCLVGSAGLLTHCSTPSNSDEAGQEVTTANEPSGQDTISSDGGQGQESASSPEITTNEAISEAIPEPIVEATPKESSNKTCTFNTDCPTGERCECDEQTGCFCKVGARGTGKSGVDPCKSGDDCETALCNEGTDGSFYCSGPCESDSDCQSKLPICSNIAFLGKVCIRKKP